jgi:hypothetical protein
MLCRAEAVTRLINHESERVCEEATVAHLKLPEGIETRHFPHGVKTNAIHTCYQRTNLLRTGRIALTSLYHVIGLNGILISYLETCLSTS